MPTLILACGPYFNEKGLIGALVLFLLVKPLAYFAFIQAFRYRVSRPIPMRFSQAAKLAAYRAALGIGMVSLGAGVLMAFPSEEMMLASWAFLYVERLFSWWLVGSWCAGLQGRRLLGWVVAGTLMNAAFDGAVVLGITEGLGPQIALMSGLLAFIVLLHIFGRRESLKARFSSDVRCAMCLYDLTGNLSGRCPECGHVLDAGTDQAALA